MRPTSFFLAVGTVGFLLSQAISPQNSFAAGRAVLSCTPTGANAAFGAVISYDEIRDDYAIRLRHAAQFAPSAPRAKPKSFRGVSGAIRPADFGLKNGSLISDEVTLVLYRGNDASVIRARLVINETAQVQDLSCSVVAEVPTTVVTSCSTQAGSVPFVSDALDPQAAQAEALRACLAHPASALDNSCRKKLACKEVASVNPIFTTCAIESRALNLAVTSLDAQTASLVVTEQCRLHGATSAEQCARRVKCTSSADANAPDLERDRIEAERQARIEAERQARIEAERQARIEAERQARIEAERQARIEAERQARIEAERQARIEAERQARIEAERQARIEAERQARIDAERQARIERERAERQARIEAERQARIEAERQARIEAERQARIERERAERQARIEAERQARIDAERRERQERERRERERPPIVIVNPEPRVLGGMQWRAKYDHTYRLTIRGTSITKQVLAGPDNITNDGADWDRGMGLPSDRAVNVVYTGACDGSPKVTIQQHPRKDNGFTAIIDINESKGGTNSLCVNFQFIEVR